MTLIFRRGDLSSGNGLAPRLCPRGAKRRCNTLQCAGMPEHVNFQNLKRGVA